jgi:hypothetical protein
MKLNMDHRWKDTDWGNRSIVPVPLCPHEINMEWYAINPEPSRWEAGLRSLMLFLLMYRNSVRTAGIQWQCPLQKNSRLMLLREIIAVFFWVITKCMNPLCGTVQSVLLWSSALLWRINKAQDKLPAVAMIALLDCHIRAFNFVV